MMWKECQKYWWFLLLLIIVFLEFYIEMDGVPSTKTVESCKNYVVGKQLHSAVWVLPDIASTPIPKNRQPLGQICMKKYEQKV